MRSVPSIGSQVMYRIDTTEKIVAWPLESSLTAAAVVSVLKLRNTDSSNASVFLVKIQGFTGPDEKKSIRLPALNLADFNGH